ncbi:MAG: nitrilase-related carbon-nitrogen hydrolase [Bacteroidia bacterium]|nr:amidohydrolase [Bacteroidia bacterium]MDW8334171.1 nitrilase-related carbon-nitrogen hydrolase [Bacteroidia bacterium]
MKMLLYQFAPAWMDRRANFETIERDLERAPRCDLVVLPETFATGFTDSADHAEDDDGPTRAWMLETARRLETTILGSAAVRDGDRCYNRAFVAFADGRCLRYDKRYLFSPGGEAKNYCRGTEKLTFEVGGMRVRPFICYDLRFGQWCRNRDEYDAAVFIASWPAVRAHHWRRLLAARAVENQCYVAGVNRIGRDGKGVAYSGDTGLWDWNGDLVAPEGRRAQVFHEPGFFVYSLNLAALKEYREKFPVWRDMDD